MNRADLISVDNYSSEPALNPQNESTKLKYIKIYKDYSLGSLTYRQLAEKYNMTFQYINEIIKWVVFQMKDKAIGRDEKLQALVDDIRERKQTLKDLEEMLRMKLKDGKISSREYTDICREIRMSDKLEAQLEGLLSTALIDQSDKRQITVITNDLKRRAD